VDIQRPTQEPDDGFHRDRLDDVPVEAGLPAHRDVERLAEPTHGNRQDSLEARMAAQPADEAEPVEAWHLKVTQDEIGRPIEDSAERLLAILSPPRLRAKRLDELDQRLPRVRGVLHDEDLESP